MHEQFLRTEMVLGKPALERLQSANVAEFGLGVVFFFFFFFLTFFFEG